MLQRLVSTVHVCSIYIYCRKTVPCMVCLPDIRGKKIGMDLANVCFLTWFPRKSHLKMHKLVRLDVCSPAPLPVSPPSLPIFGKASCYTSFLLFPLPGTQGLLIAALGWNASSLGQRFHEIDTRLFRQNFSQKVLFSCMNLFCQRCLAFC